MRKVETEETVAGGRVILPQSVREGMTGQQVEVVAVGLEALCADEDCERSHAWQTITPLPGIDRYQLDDRLHPCSVKVGAWAVVAPRSFGETDEPGVYVVMQDDVLAVVER